MKGGKLEGYSGWRRSLKGTRFRILEATLFNVSSPTGKSTSLPGRPLLCHMQPRSVVTMGMGCAGDVLGQAAKIGQWSYEDGRIEGPDAEPGATVPTPEDIAAAGKLNLEHSFIFSVPKVFSDTIPFVAVQRKLWRSRAARCGR